MAKSYNDPAKQRAREKLKDFIAENLLTFRKPEDTRVVCFPGAEQDGEEALEVKEVYDPLGIPRQNIVGLEIDPRVAKRLQKANLGIEVVCQDAGQYFANTDRTFEVISLDYKGQRTWKEADITRYIAGRGVLSGRSIFCTAHSTKREGKKMQEQFLDSAFFSNAPLELLQNLRQSGDLKGLAEQIVNHKENRIDSFHAARDALRGGAIPLSKLRNQITRSNMAVLGSGNLDLDPSNNLFGALPNYLKDFLKLSKIFKAHFDDTRGIASKVPFFDAHKCLFQDYLVIYGANMVSNGMTPEQAKQILQVLGVHHSKGYIPSPFERYTYTSNTGTPMLMDIYAPHRLNYTFYTKAIDLALIAGNGELIINPQNMSPRKFLKKLEDFSNEARNIPLTHTIEDPIYLGSSYKPKERISRADAIELLRAGCSPAEIAECYCGWRVPQLAALKAHYVTVGKFADKHRSPEVLELRAGNN